VAATPQRIPMFIGDRCDDFELKPLVNVSQSILHLHLSFLNLDNEIYTMIAF